MFVSFTLIYYNIIKQWTYNVFFVWFSRGGRGRYFASYPQSASSFCSTPCCFCAPGFNYIHRRPIINTSSYNPTAVSRHFITGNHTVNHMLLIPPEKLYTNRDSIRKAREAFLIHRGNTLEPAGLNRRDEM